MHYRVLETKNNLEFHQIIETHCSVLVNEAAGTRIWNSLPRGLRALDVSSSKQWRSHGGDWGGLVPPTCFQRSVFEMTEIR